MRAAVIFGLGTSRAKLAAFRAEGVTEWIEGVPRSSSDADAIVIFGGDGTIHRHLAALVRLQLPVLVVPSGSGNDFARALHLKSIRDSLEAWRKFGSGKGNIRAIDVGTVTETNPEKTKHYFACVAGCGLDAAAARGANRMPRWLRRNGGYALSLLPLLFKLPSFPMRFTYYNDDEQKLVEESTLLSAFANTQYYGDGMRIAPQADPADGRLDVCRISMMNPLRLLCLFPTVYFGRHLGIREVTYSKTQRVRVDSPMAQEIYADGEYVCRTPVEIGVDRGALKVITPESI
jgi:diacylglycerol kinase (ATP)